MLDRLEQTDRELLIWFNQLFPESWDLFWLWVTRIDVWIPLFVLFIAILLKQLGWKRGGLAVLTIVLTFLLVYSLTYLCKISVARLRPNNESGVLELLRLIIKPTDFSFFSGHASSSAAIGILVVMYLKHISKWYWLFLLWPVLFMCSRLVLAVHYPSDVLIGCLVGICIGLIFYRLSKRRVLGS